MEIPQAFSHFTYVHTHCKMLVCDLQGVLDKNTQPFRFQLTDPVIHYSSLKGRTSVHGRTDHGAQGIKMFFDTHRCWTLCRLLDLTRTRP